MKLCAQIDCTGCMSCYNACNHDAIVIEKDKEGFDYPEINPIFCIDCGLCREVCPALNIGNVQNSHSFAQQYYSGWASDKKIRKESSSGGVFSVLAKRVIEKDGVVFGASLDNIFSVYHMYIFSKSDLQKLRGSKYVQSRIGSIYRDVKRYLLQDRWVLFSGTPCQIAGLKSFLRKEYEKLICVDIICHGVPSPKLFEDYKEYIQHENGIIELQDIQFRRKKKSWIYYNIEIKGGTVDNKKKTYFGHYYQDPWIRGYLRNNFLRPACYKCRYTSLNREGDITIADFWRYQPATKKDNNYDKLGVSLIIVNTINGKKLFDLCQKDLVYLERTAEEALRTNRCLYEPYGEPTTRDFFWQDYYSLGFSDVVRKWMYHEYLTIEQKLNMNHGLNILHDRELLLYILKNKLVAIKRKLKAIKI